MQVRRIKQGKCWCWWSDAKVLWCKHSTVSKLGSDDEVWGRVIRIFKLNLGTQAAKTRHSATLKTQPDTGNCPGLFTWGNLCPLLSLTFVKRPQGCAHTPGGYSHRHRVRMRDYYSKCAQLVRCLSQCFVHEVMELRVCVSDNIFLLLNLTYCPEKKRKSYIIGTPKVWNLKF